MSGLKYGRVYISKGEILEALGLSSDVHVELVGDSNDGAVEFQVVANDNIEHECLSKTPSQDVAGLRRFHVPIVGESVKSETLEKLNRIIEFYCPSDDKYDIFSLLESMSEASTLKEVPYSDLLEALYKTSLVDEEAKVYSKDVIKYAIAVLTTIKESGETVGNFLKTVFTRVRQDSVEKLLEDEIFYYVSGYNPIEQIASSWDRLEQKTKEKIAQAIAGKYHIARFMVLMSELNK